MIVMAHSSGIEELRERLTLYALGMLPEDETRAIAEHLAEGCPECEAEVRAVQETVCTVAETSVSLPPPMLRERVLASARPREPTDQVWKEWSPSAGDVIHAQAAEGPWDPVAPGVSARRLYVDSARGLVTMLIRMAPGSTYSAHRHAAPEQCFVLEGDIFDGERTYRAGDFQCKAERSVHGVQSTENGCLLLLVSSLSDELLV